MKLYKYQKEAIDLISEKFIVQNQRGFLLADETGLGKGVQALQIGHELQTNRPANRPANLPGIKTTNMNLILCQSFTKPKWIEEVQTKLPKKRKYLISIKTYNEISNPSYLRMVMRHTYDLIIIDEGHCLKDFESLRTRAVYSFPGSQAKPLISVCNHILNLTATPYPNRVGEIYPFLWAINHRAIKNKTEEEFIARYAEEYRVTEYGIKHRGVQNEIELKSKMSDIFLRREKIKVLKNLPKTFRDFIPIEYDSKTFKKEQELLNELLISAGYSKFQVQTLLKSDELLDNIIDLVPSFEQLAIFKKQQGLLKIKVVYDYLKENILIDPANQKFILFTFHKDVVFKYHDLITKDFPNLPVITITGQTDKNERFQIIKEANKMQKCILICSMQSVETSLDFIGFDTSYFAEIDWLPKLLTQCEGRTHRIGQKKKVRWIYFIFNRGIEKKIYDTLNDKKRTIDKLLN